MIDEQSAGTSRRGALRLGAAAMSTAILAAALPGRAAAVGAGAEPGADGASAGDPHFADDFERATASLAAAAATSYNGWPVGSPMEAIGVANHSVAGTSIQIAVKSGDVATVLMYLAQRFHAEVEPLRGGQVGGYSYRRNVNNPSVWSNHASGTAMDLNFNLHPNGSRGTFTSGQVAAIRRILEALGGVVYWGGDYTGTTDEMHFEIDVEPGDARLPAAVARIRGPGSPPPGASQPGSGAASYLAGRHEIFGVGTDGVVYQSTSFDGSGFSSWKRPVGGGFRSTPAVILRTGRCDIFGIGADLAAYRIKYQGGWEPGFHRVGGSFQGGLTATYQPGRYDLFGVGMDGRLLQSVSTDGVNYSAFSSPVGGTYSATPAAIFRGGQYDIFAFGADNKLYRITWNGGWRAPQAYPAGRFSGGVAATFHDGRYDLFAVDLNGKLRQTISTDGRNFSVWHAPVPGTFRATPAATYAAGRYDLFLRGGDAAMKHVRWRGVWSTPANLGGRFMP